MSSLFESRQKAKGASTGGVTRPGLTADRMKEMLATGRRVQNEYLAKQKEAIPTSTPQGRFGGSSLSNPQPQISTLSASTKSRAENLMERGDERLLKSSGTGRDFFRKELGGIGKFIFGSSEEEYLGTNKRIPAEGEGFIKSIQEDVRSRGAVKLLYGNLTKVEGERVADAAAALSKQGYTRNEANNLATQYYKEGNEAVPQNVKLTIQSLDTAAKAWATVEIIDLIPVLRAGSKTLGRTALKDTLAKSLAADNALESRKILSEAFPALKGTKELDDLMTLNRTMADDGKAKQFLETVMAKREFTEVSSTQAQRVFYENGIPIVRGGREAATTVTRGGQAVPSQTADALALRTEIRNVLAGEAEAARLSNIDVFADEIKAGAFPFKATPEGEVKLFAAETVSDATRLRPGERLATSKEALEATLEKGKAKMLSVMPDDVVRLADGTFVYAPKKELGKGISGTLRSLREGQRAKVQAVEKSREISREQRRLAVEENAAKAVEQRRVNAAVKAEASARKIQEVGKAREILATQSTQAKRLIDDAVATKKARIAEVRAAAKVAETNVREAARTLRKLITSIGNTPKAIAAARDKARRAIDKTRALKGIDAKEKAKRVDKIRIARDKEIARLTKEKGKLSAQADKARGQLSEAKAQVFDKDAAITKINAETSAIAKQVKADSRTMLAEAKQVVSSVEATKAKAKIVKAKETNKAKSTELAEVLRETFSTTAQTLEEVKVGSPLKPVKNDGKTVPNQIIKGLEEELEVIKKSFEERGLSLSDLPDTHKAIGNPTLLKRAFADMVEDPYKVYNDFVSGVMPDGTTRAAYGLALMKSDFILSNPTRLDLVARAFLKGNTRIGQELQSIKIFGRMDYLNIVSRFTQQADELLKARGVNVETEAKALLKLFDGEIDGVKTVAKSDIIEAISAITCKV